MKTEINSCRQAMLYHSAKTGKMLSISYKESMDRVQLIDVDEELDEGDLEEVEYNNSEGDKPISRETRASPPAKLKRKIQSYDW